MSNYNDLKAQVPMLVSNDPVMDEIYSIQGSKLDSLQVDKESLLAQLFVDEATWGLELWENFLGIHHDVRKSDVERRGAIKSKLLGTKVFTIQMIKDMANIFGYAVAFIQENIDPYTVKIKLTSATDFVQVRSFMSTINDLKPAHLEFVYLYNLTIWNDVEASMVDYETLNSYKWQDFLINGEGDGASVISDLIGLKLWSGEDVFLYKDFNHNFVTIDAKFSGTTGHTHNGTDSLELGPDSILYDIDETVLDRMIAIDDSIGSTEGKANVATAIGLPALSTDSFDVMASKVMTSKTSIATALTNKGQAATNSETLDSYATKVRALAGTVTPAGTALPEEVLEGKTFVNSAGKQTGTAPLRSGLVYMPKADADWLIHGFQDGTCVIPGDPDLIPANIKKGVTICGVTGITGEPDYLDGSYIPSGNVQVNFDGNGNVVSYTILA